MGRTMTEAERKRCLVEAGYNVFMLDPSDVELDIFTDIPPRSYLPNAPGDRAEAREPDLQGLAEALYGPARYVTTTRGRSAEFALMNALQLKGTVLTNGLFMSTERALRHFGATV